MYFTIVASDSDLQHHGIKGQKWGVRRYQNYDGSYTKKGLERYNKAAEKYASVKQQRKEGTATRADVRLARKEANQAYKQLKLDKLADQGKELYKSGHTITSNSDTAATLQAAVIAGSGVARYVLSSYGNQKYADIAAVTIAAGGTAINAIISGKNAYENKRLRAYYAH